MSMQTFCLPLNTPLVSVAQTMAEKKFSCMVIGEKNIPTGIVTERDLARALLKTQHQTDLLQQPVSRFMSSPVIRLNRYDSLYDAVVVLQTQKVRHLPVVDDQDQLVGMVTQSDLSNAHFKVIEMQPQIVEQNIAAKTELLLKANKELQALTLEDHLMQIGNRRAMEADLQHTHSASVRYQRNYSIALFDIDFFKRYNDYYGHAQGDRALRIVADYLKKTIRSSDRLYRYGGEELLLLFPETDCEGARLATQRLLGGLAALEEPHEKSPIGLLTASAGIGCFTATEPKDSWKDVVEVADKALYQAKSAGRNQVKA
ncbi:MAG: GGDEF domain-containing protein [Motiliproteus sp.]